MERNLIVEKKKIIFEQIEDFTNLIDIPIQQESSVFLATEIVFLFLSLFLFIRFVFKISSILNLKKSGEKFKNTFGSIVLHSKIKGPFSFLDTIYLNIDSWKKNKIETEILIHEQGHIVQKHSFDVLFIEILKIVFWFQPMIYFYKRAIQENHEFLADAYCLEKTNNIKEYQTIILNYYKEQNNKFELSSSFNYQNLKKRFMIMKKTKKANVKQVMFCTAFVTIIFVGLVGIETKASTINNLETVVLNKVDGLIKPNVSQVEKNDSSKTKNDSFENSDKTHKETIVLEYTKDKQTSGYISVNDVIYYYVISPELEVSIYNRYGVKENEKDFKYELKQLNVQNDVEALKKNELERQNQIEVTTNELDNQSKKFIKASPKEGMEVFKNEFNEKANFIIPKDVSLFKVVLKITIEVDGSFSNITVVNDVDKLNREEAIRVIKSMPKWNPATENGQVVVSDFYFPITMAYKEVF